MDRISKKTAKENLKNGKAITCQKTDGLGKVYSTEIYFSGEEIKRYTRFTGGSDQHPETIDMKQANEVILDSDTVFASDCPNGWQF